jgi:hypothetical protein
VGHLVHDEFRKAQNKGTKVTAVLNYKIVTKNNLLVPLHPIILSTLITGI